MNWAVGTGDLALVAADYSVDPPDPHCEGDSEAKDTSLLDSVFFVLLKSIAKANGFRISKKEITKKNLSLIHISEPTRPKR